MKILHVVHAYPPSLGGSQTLIAKLSERLVARYDDQVTVYTTVARNTDYFWGGDNAELPVGVEQINGVIVRRFPVFTRLHRLRWFLSGIAYRLHLPYNDWLRTWQTGPLIIGLRRAIAQSQADVILATAFPLWHMYDAVEGARLAGIPIVLLGALHIEDAWGYDRPMIYRAIRCADAYIAHTEYERRFLVEQKGIPASTIQVIGAGVDIVSPDKRVVDAQRQEHGGDGDTPVVLSIGKQVSRKRFDLLINAMRLVWEQYPAVRLVLAGGRTAYELEIKRMIAELPQVAQANVTLISDVSEQEKAAILAACDIFVLASGQESFGIAFVEAWSYDKPVVAARSGAITSLIDDGIDGLLFNYPQPASLAQAIMVLLDSPSLRQRMGQAGKQKVLEQYTWDRVTEQVRAVFAQVVGGSLGGRVKR